ncbi:MAG: DUF4124 domain-containing protein [Pseudomonadota bacterium]
MRLLLIGLLCVGLPAAAAEVYTYIDADGNRVFTDSPGQNKAQRIEMAPSNQISNQPAAIRPPPAYNAPVLAPVYQLLRILVPEPDATIRDGSTGDLIVTASSEPGLLAGHNYRLLLDGKPVGDPGRSPVFPLKDVDRGTHQLAVEILDEQGRILERTPTQPFHMMRISLAQKRMTNPCETGDYGVRLECPLSDKPVVKPSLLQRLLPGILKPPTK